MMIISCRCLRMILVRRRKRILPWNFFFRTRSCGEWFLCKCQLLGKFHCKLVTVITACVRLGGPEQKANILCSNLFVCLSSLSLLFSLSPFLWQVAFLWNHAWPSIFGAERSLGWNKLSFPCHTFSLFTHTSLPLLSLRKRKQKLGENPPRHACVYILNEETSSERAFIKSSSGINEETSSEQVSTSLKIHLLLLQPCFVVASWYV